MKYLAMSRQRLIFAPNKKDDAMKNLESKYSEQVISKAKKQDDIYSKTIPDIESKTTSDIISTAKKAKGANDIVALAGAFSACKVDDWKLEKEHYLKSSI